MTNRADAVPLEDFTPEEIQRLFDRLVTFEMSTPTRPLQPWQEELIRHRLAIVREPSEYIPLDSIQAEFLGASR
ncbi:MAG: hypothetical protein ACRCZF_23815 [Gemmataceae bacterium]